MLNRVLGQKVTFNEFIEAARAGGDAGLATVNQYIQENDGNFFAINMQDAYGNTAFMWAAERGHTAIVIALLSTKNVLINHANKDGSTALIRAANMGRIDTVRVLVAQDGIAINAANRSGATALMCAVCNGHIAIVRDHLLPRLTLEEIMTRDTHYTAAQYAKLHGHRDLAKLIEAWEKALHAAVAVKRIVIPHLPTVAQAAASSSSASLAVPSEVADQETERARNAKKRLEFFASPVGNPSNQQTAVAASSSVSVETNPEQPSAAAPSVKTLALKFNIRRC